MLDDFGDAFMVTLVILGVLAALSVGWWIVRRRRAAAELERYAPIPLISIPAEGSGVAPVPPPPPRRRAPRRADSLGATAVEERPARAIDDLDVDVDDDDLRFAPASPSAPPSAPHRRAGDMMTGPAVEGHSVRFYRPAEGTLQFLPGRLEIVDGRDEGQEIRFVRTFGPDGSQVTFGRQDGPPYRHVQLRQPTVSRNHARMTLEHGAWRLTNLSRTNPVIVNGELLDPDEGTVVLHDGDRIEMGEVIFRYRDR
jgi:hypothetical protein